MTTFITRTVGDVIAEVIMIRSTFAGSFLVLEGDDDVNFWKTRVAPRSDCQLVLAGGKHTVIGAVQGANAAQQKGLLGIVDDDYDSLLGVPDQGSNVVPADTRDLETLMLRGPALERVLTELGDGRKMHDLIVREDRSVRQALVDRALIFGQLRYLSAANHWGVSFDRLSPYRFADDVTWTFDHSMIVGEFLKQLSGVTRAEVQNSLAAANGMPSWSVLHGKDTLCVLAVGLRRVLGNQQCRYEQITRMLRLAFDLNALRETGVFRAIRTWEDSNSPFRVLST